MDRIQWIDFLCPRMKHILQVKFSKEYQYDFVLAEGAVKHSIWMMQTGNFRHCSFVNEEEILGVVGIEGNDEGALRRIVDCWYKSNRHNLALRNNDLFGIGLAYDDRLDLLYATIRLRR